MWIVVVVDTRSSQCIVNQNDRGGQIVREGGSAGCIAVNNPRYKYKGVKVVNITSIVRAS